MNDKPLKRQLLSVVLGKLLLLLVLWLTLLHGHDVKVDARVMAERMQNSNNGEHEHGD
jgi:hypothetical protein